MRVGYLGPEGTFSEEALIAAAGDEVERVPLGTIYDVVMATREGAVDRGLVPIENSIEGSVNIILDTLAGEASDLAIVGELVLAVHQCLIAARPVPIGEITTVVSHPQAAGQCARFLRTELPQAKVRTVASTAEAVRMVVESGEPTWAALGTRLAATIYAGQVLAQDVQDLADNETRFVWLARASDAGPPPDPGASGGGAPGAKTSIVFWGEGAQTPGWLVACLDELARRQVNLTRIESRPRRERLGNYMFFADLEGSVADPVVAEAIAGLREHCEDVRVLGSYPLAS